MRTVAYLLIICCLIACDTNRSYQIEKVAESDFLWTGIAVSNSGRIFVNFPTWGFEKPFHVAELIDGELHAYPNEETNLQFKCVQSVVMDNKQRLWILDPANPYFQGVVPDGAKLFQVNIKNNAIERTFTFDSIVAPKKSYLNDIRVDTENEIAYITDSGLGGIVMLDLKSGKSYRRLNQNCDKVLANLSSIEFSSTGEWKGIVHSDGIEISADFGTLYFTALTGDILYQIKTSFLLDLSIEPDKLCEYIEVLNPDNVPTDGLWYKDNKLFMANLPDENVRCYYLNSGLSEDLFENGSIRWADSFAEDGEGNIYFTTSQLNYPMEQKEKYEIYKLILK